MIKKLSLCDIFLKINFILEFFLEKINLLKNKIYINKNLL